MSGSEKYEKFVWRAVITLWLFGQLKNELVPFLKYLFNL